MLAAVPPEKPPRIDRTARRTACQGTPSGSGLLLKEEHTEIGRQRIESAAVHDAGAGPPGCLLMSLEHAADRLRLPGQVAESVPVSTQTFTRREP